MIGRIQLAKVSLAEVFQILAQTKQTGLLTIDTHTDKDQPLQKSYIWLQWGCIVAVDNRLDGQGLISKIEQRNWINHETLSQMIERCPVNMPLGIFLRAENALNTQQLKLLFYAQVLQPVCSLFKLKEGKLEFNSMETLPLAEMTGLSLSAARATLLGLRVLRDWEGLSANLPNPNSALKRGVLGKPNFKLDILEKKVWVLATGENSLEAIAEELSLTIEKVQQIAFRLIMAGLAAEISPEGTSVFQEIYPNFTSFLKAGLKKELVTGQKKGDRFLPNFLTPLHQSA